MPIANANITLSIGPFVREVEYTTDAWGQAEISVDTTNFTMRFVHIEAYYKCSSSCGSEWVKDHQCGHHTAKRFYSASESYLHIDSILGTVNCDEVPPPSQACLVETWERAFLVAIPVLWNSLPKYM
ncbi:alpha-1-macroglobulin-like [Varanus komodoensis]|uniref:alpha-1-macroglobulin-like n=1 Tax=Varanus komodoensis TaxID=61221 RepID=UPI001CF767CF|nr:alpha-1-macroglobulin-like [Varanus komodoensis]